MTSRGAGLLDIVPEAKRHRLRSPEDWWPMVLGTGYRGTIEQLDAAQREGTKTLLRLYPRPRCGMFTRGAALQQLLSGTGLELTYTGERAFTLTPIRTAARSNLIV
ncbi:STN domain-containing protein [Bradyrhizobium sp. 31Argb]|uniref:STN domain-containing protein n=1 Tax=Bradyrhizobium sp. 31Argb TaxID=3141247 RepID=UPI003748A42F